MVPSFHSKRVHMINDLPMSILLLAVCSKVVMSNLSKVLVHSHDLKQKLKSRYTIYFSKASPRGPCVSRSYSHVSTASTKGWANEAGEESACCRHCTSPATQSRCNMHSYCGRVRKSNYCTINEIDRVTYYVSHYLGFGRRQSWPCGRELAEKQGIRKLGSIRTPPAFVQVELLLLITQSPTTHDMRTQMRLIHTLR